MKKVYTAQHPTEAYIVKGILESAGIPSRVRGDILFAARGEIPLTEETAPSVWIEQDGRLSAAKEIIARYERANAGDTPEGGSWQCQQCNEVCEPQFSHCWKCGLARM